MGVLPTGRRWGVAVAAAALVLSAQPAHAAEASIPAGLKYVALGSSFAAGPGIPSPQPGTPAACGRSTNNYASLVAREPTRRTGCRRRSRRSPPTPTWSPSRSAATT